MCVSNNYVCINNLSILNILTSLWLEYSNYLNNYVLMEGDIKTDWWAINIIENYANDFSWKGRANWPPFSFVKSYLWLNDKETFDWFKNNFGIDGNYDKTKTKQKQNKHQKRIKYCSDW